MKHINFKSSYYCIAYELLCSPNRKWSSWMFPGFRRNDVIEFTKILIRLKIIYRKYSRGPMGTFVLKEPEKLLNLCIDKFRNSEKKVFQFMSKRSHADVLKDIKSNKIEYYLGRFSGVQPEIRDVYDNKLAIIIPDRSYFEGYKLQKIQLDLGIGKVPLEGDIIFVYPRYGNFLRYKHQTVNEENIPSDFYTYLAMASSKNSLALHQAEFIKKKLKGKHGNFLSWE